MYMNTQQGFVKWIIIIIIALIVLGYYGFDIRKAVEAPTTQSNLTYVQQIVSTVWHKYLKAPAVYLWNIFKKYIWQVALDSLDKMSRGEPTVIDQASPKVNEVGTSSP